jgi:hypothetical protein
VNDVPLADVASVIRSKNAGPYELVLDVLFAEEATYRRLKEIGYFTAALVEELYHVPPGTVLAVHHFDPSRAVKITMKRWIPSGNVGDTDVYGAQQHAPLYSLRVPAAAAGR